MFENGAGNILVGVFTDAAPLVDQGDGLKRLVDREWLQLLSQIVCQRNRVGGAGDRDPINRSGCIR
jgi:hypothetical protein